MKAKITGRITPEQELKLNKILDGSDATRIDFLRMLELEKQLETTKMADETINIAGQVMQKISTKKQVKKTYWLDLHLLETLFNPFPVRFAMILLTGILIGAAFTWMLISEKTDANREMLSGTMSVPSKQGISYSNQNNIIKLIPYQIGNLHYLNFIVDTPNEIKIEVVFLETDLKIKKADYISTEGNKSTNIDVGSFFFTTSGITSFQIILEKLQDQQTPITITALQNHSVLITKQLFLE